MIKAKDNIQSAVAAMITLGLVFLLTGIAVLIPWTSDLTIPRLIAGISLVVFSFVPVLVRIIQIRTRSLTVDNGIIKYNHGVVEKVEIEVNVKGISAVIIRISLFHRFFGGAEIGLACYGIGGGVSSTDINRITINDVANYKEIVEEINRVRS